MSSATETIKKIRPDNSAAEQQSLEATKLPPVNATGSVTGSVAVLEAFIAEGVETEEQVLFLEETKCDMIQGYYFYKPMAIEEFGELIN